MSKIDSGQHVVGVRSLAHARQGGPGEPRSGIDGVVQVDGRDHLYLGGAVYIDELDQQVFDIVIQHPLPDFCSISHDDLLGAICGRLSQRIQRVPIRAVDSGLDPWPAAGLKLNRPCWYLPVARAPLPMPQW